MGSKVKSPFVWLLWGALSIWVPYGVLLIILLFPKSNLKKRMLFAIGAILAFLRPTQPLPNWIEGTPKHSIQILNYMPVRNSCQGEALYQTQKILWTYANCQHIQEGDILEIKGYFKKDKTLKIPNTFSYQTFLRQQGFHGFLQIQNLTTRQQSYSLFSLSKIRSTLRQRIQTTLPYSSPLIQALLLGEKQSLSKATKKDIQRLGLSHLLAISGMHIGFLAFLLLQVFKTLRFPYKTSYILSVLTVLLFLPLCHSPDSALRAWVMYATWVYYQIREQKGSPWNIIAFAACLLLFVSPNSLYNLGFQLSFFAVSAILYIMPHLKKYNSLLQSLLLSSWISLLLLPLIALHFHEVSLWSPISNLIAVPLCFAIMITSIGSLLGFPFWGATCEFLTLLFQKTNSALASIATPLTLSNEEILYVLPIILFLILRLSPIHKAISYCITLISILSLFLYFYLNPKPILKVHFLDVNQGNAILLESEKNSLWVDLGSKPYHSNALWQYQKSLGIPIVDALLITHADYDHWAAAPNMLKAFHKIWITPQSFKNPKPNWQRFLKDNSSKTHTIQAGDNILFDRNDISVKVLYPYQSQNTLNNDASIVLHIRIGKQDILLTGDLEKEGEELLQQNYSFQDSVEIYLAGHHGSKTSNSTAFLSHVKPKEIIVSSGTHKGWQHPHPSLLQKAEKLQIPIWQTKKCGSFLVSIYKDSIQKESTHCPSFKAK